MYIGVGISFIKLDPYIVIKTMPIEPHDQIDGYYKYSFDLTDFESALRFKNLINLFGLTQYKEISRDADEEGYRRFCWFSDDIYLVTGNNPLTGQYREPSTRSLEKGYASYIGLVGSDKQKMRAIIESITAVASHIKDQGQGFIGLSKADLEGLNHES